MMEKKESLPSFGRDGLVTEADLRFVHAVLGEAIVPMAELCEILCDDAMRRDILDSRCLFQALLDEREHLQVSDTFYYTTLVRQVMLEAGLDEIGYTERTVAALLRMIRLQHAHLQRHYGESLRYYPLHLSVLRTVESNRVHLRIFSEIDPFQMTLEGEMAEYDQTSSTREAS